MRLRYFISLSVKSIMRDLTNNILIVVSLAIGMILPAVVFSYAYDSYRQVKGSEPNNYKNILIIDPAAVWSKEDVARIKQYSDEIDYITSYGSFRSIIVGNMACIYSDIMYIDGNFGKMYGSENDNITFFTPEEVENAEMICILGSNAAKELNLKQNDTININGFDLTVKDIIRMGKFSDYIFIPVTCEEVIPAEIYPTHYITFRKKLDDIDDLGKFLDIIRSEIGDFKAYRGEEEYPREAKGAFTAYIILFLLSSSVLVYALVNIVSMVFYKFDLSRYRFGVEISLGATKGSIYVQCFIELLILSLFSAGIVLALVPVIVKAVSAVIEPVRFHYSIAVFLVAVALAVSGILSMFLLRRIFRMSTNEIIRR